jgi:Flp pilus assembly pilin Flp
MIGLILRRAKSLVATFTTHAAADGGQALIEYALIISLIAIVAIGALQTTGVNIHGLLNRIAGEV